VSGEPDTPPLGDRVHETGEEGRMRPPGPGAAYVGNHRCEFSVWAPLAETAGVHILQPRERTISLERGEGGWFRRLTKDVSPGSFYLYRLTGGKERPDPASRYQPEGVHGPSQVIDPAFPWEDAEWPGICLEDHVIYELHVGTYTTEGSFEAVIPHLDTLIDLGVTAVELMPVAQFPGERNWGYDGVYPFAVQNSYGGPAGLKRLVNACHRRGLAVVLDVVYNHLGPEGNYLWDYGPYFTDRYKTPWSSAINFDGPDSDEVRYFFIENALYWIRVFHMDALRIDAVHAIYDFSAQPFLEELALAVHEESERLNRRVHLIAESALNDTRLIRSRGLGGFGLDAQWNDDFHHALHALLTEERTGYYMDFGRLDHLAKAYREGYVYTGEYSVYRRRRHGNPSRRIPAARFVVFAQNHDQAGNRMRSERLSRLVTFEALKLAAGVVLLSPFIPLLFMGEEYGEDAPFPFFTSHLDTDLVEAVREGRRDEFASFRWEGEPPDPQDEATFLSAKLNHRLRLEGQGKTLFNFYRELLRLRKGHPVLSRLSKEELEVTCLEREDVLCIRRWFETDQIVSVFHFGKEMASLRVPLAEGRWVRRIDSTDTIWQGPGSPVPHRVESTGETTITMPPTAFVLFTKQKEK
jgi:maltooligosyltrehalose trehalohydrolase